MRLLKWLKPTAKIGVGGLNEVAGKDVKETLRTRLLQMSSEVNIDTIYSDIVLRRFLLTLYWGDVGTLFEALISSRKDVPMQVAVSVQSYFKSAGCSPSACLERLALYLEKSQRVPYSVSEDIERLIQQLTEIQRISNN